MKIKLLNEIPKIPADMDRECISLYYTLNRLPGLEKQKQ